MENDSDQRVPFMRPNRRRFLAGSGALAVAALAGCTGDDSTNSTDDSDDSDDSDNSNTYNGPGVTTEGTSWDDLPELSGELTIYSGRKEAQIGPILSMVEDRFDDLTLDIRYADNEAHVNAILEAGEQTNADIIYTQDSGTLGALAGEGRTLPLTDDVLDTVPNDWRDPDGTWTGLSGRVRCVAYNTDTWSADDLPDEIFAYPEDDRFENEMGWRVDSGSFLAFIRAMMIEHGNDRAREFIEGMQDAGINNYEGGSTTPEALAAGEVTVGFVNQYYVGRLLADRPEEPVDVTFTDRDVGSLFNVAGAGVVDATDHATLGKNFVRVMLSREVQEEFVGLNKEYSVLPSVEYVGDLPSLDEIDPPEFDLNQLADIQPAVDLLRETGLR